MPTPETILVIDDESRLRMNLRAFLEDTGYQVLEAASGAEAFGLLDQQRPSLILLDINMPGMSGYDVCRHLKADPDTAEIPVIFLSAFLWATDKVAAFDCGGVDYVTKPLQFEDVAARVRTHLEIHRQRRLLQEQHDSLARLEAQRNAFTHMMAHDMKSPLTGLMCSLGLALEGLPPQLSTERSHLKRAQACAERVLSMINKMLELNRLETGSMPLSRCHFDLSGLARETADSLHCIQGHRRLTVSGPVSGNASGDQELVRRVLTNLLENAFKFTPDGSAIEVQVTYPGAFARVAVIDEGPGIAPEHHRAIFGKFSQASTEYRNNGFGLGLAFCKLAVEAQGGEIGVESRPGKGSAFWFTLPGSAG